MKRKLAAGLDFEIPVDMLLQRLHAKPGSAVEARALGWARQVKGVACPGYLIQEVCLDRVDREGFCVEGRRFTSRIAAHKLAGSPRVFLYIATSGPEISARVAAATDPLDEYILDQIAYLAYLEANTRMLKALCEDFGVEKHIRLCPGSVLDWSVADVTQFFAMLEGEYQPLGVRVLPSGLIDPIKSTSGLLVETQEEFESCSICPRQNCESRREAFDLELHEKLTGL